MNHPSVSLPELNYLKDLRELCTEEDLLDLDSYDSILRSEKIANAWKGLEVIDKIIKNWKEGIEI